MNARVWRKTRDALLLRYRKCSTYSSKSLEARQRRVNGYYTELMQRGVDSAGLQTWVPLLLGNGDVDVQVSLISSEEYWNRAGVRFP